jgi:hypothetical protein
LSLQTTKDADILNMSTYYEQKVSKLQEDHAAEVAMLKANHDKEIKHVKEIAESKISSLKEAVQRLNDLLPDRDDKDGWLTKQVSYQIFWS